jgi:DNA invertase Pin-like site-specific DNA recombinase
MIRLDRDLTNTFEREGSMEAVSYCRVSMEEQAHEGVSLAAQEARVRAYCAAAGLSLIERVRDEGVSAARPLAARPGGAALLRLVARKRATHVVVVTLDRAFRSTLDCLATVQAWDRAGVSLHLVDHGGQSIATATAVGRMFLTLLAGFAEMEKRLIGERTAAAMRHQKAQRRAYARTPHTWPRPPVPQWGIPPTREGSPSVVTLWMAHRLTPAVSRTRVRRRASPGARGFPARRRHSGRRGRASWPGRPDAAPRDAG